jgi:Fe-S-cluster containining protein
VRVSGDDYERLGDRAADLVWFDGTRAHMRMHEGHCSALQIDSKNRQYLCSVYETRPQVCRDLARGSSACLAERIAKAERPLLMLDRRRLTPARSESR